VFPSPDLAVAGCNDKSFKARQDRRAEVAEIGKAIIARLRPSVTRTESHAAELSSRKVQPHFKLESGTSWPDLTARKQSQLAVLDP
jgi:hypothetical protein